MYVAVDYENITHAIALQIHPRGSIARIGFVIDLNREALKPLFLSERTATAIDETSASPDPSPAMPTPTLALSDLLATSTSTAFKDMFARFDALCNTLGDTLLEVVVAVGENWKNTDAKVHLEENAKLRDVLRGSMPRMVGRRRLVICRHKCDHSVEHLANNVFERDPQRWKDIELGG